MPEYGAISWIMDSKHKTKSMQTSRSSRWLFRSFREGRAHTRALFSMSQMRASVQRLARIFGVSGAAKQPRKRMIVEAESLAEFLSEYAVADRESYGVSYRRRYYAALAWRYVGQKFSWIGRLVRQVGWRGSVAAIGMALAIYIGGINVSSAPFARSISTETEWGRGTSDNLSLESATDAIQLASQGSWSART